MKSSIVDDSWIREIHVEGSNYDQCYTFCGALEKLYDHIAYYWNNETRKKHNHEYNNIILPALENHNGKLISDYTKEDYENAILSITERGYEQKGVNHMYSESSIHNFENLIYNVVFQASSYGYCDNVLWGTSFSFDISDKAKEIELKSMLKKSLTIKQEKALCKEVMTNIREDGARVALLLMWALGLRNGEACGLNYGDIKEIEGHPGCYAAWIYKSTKIKSNELQAGGKTFNTGRIIPIPQKLFDFLNKRKQLICEIITTQNMADVDIDALPICCDGCLDENSDSYINRCKAKLVTSEARIVFKEVDISSMQIAVLGDELSEGNVATILKEKDPTAYLLRRNFATQMCILGLNTSEMQYLIGHDVEDAYESRNEYVDSDRIYSMYLKLSQRELLNTFAKKGSKKAEICNKNDNVFIHISAIEPCDQISISFCNSKGDATVKLFEGVDVEPSFERSINCNNYYHKRYVK